MCKFLYLLYPSCHKVLGIQGITPYLVPIYFTRVECTTAVGNTVSQINTPSPIIALHFVMP